MNWPEKINDFIRKDDNHHTISYKNKKTFFMIYQLDNKFRLSGLDTGKNFFMKDFISLADAREELFKQMDRMKIRNILS